jgi:TldD protein
MRKWSIFLLRKGGWNELKKSWIENALHQAKKSGASYADIRFEHSKQESMFVKNEKLEAMESSTDQGFGIRVLIEGMWGFSSSNQLEENSVMHTLEEACAIARASSKIAGPSIELAKLAPVKAEIKDQALENPFAVNANEKIELLKTASSNMKIHEEIAVRTANYRARKLSKLFASTEGSWIEQERTESGAGISATAVGNQDVQVRSYPNSFGGDYSTFGYEFIRKMNLQSHAKRIAEEARALLYADPCPQEHLDLIIDGQQLALQVHESIGHPAELDRVLGYEASFAGTSYMTPDKLGHFRIGSEMVNITADATIPGSLGGFGYDDEGVPAQCVYLIKNGIFVGYLNSRESAHHFNQEPMGAMRADGWSKIPIIRMTSINLLPGNSTLDELISGVEHGLFVSGIKSWSIDDKRLNFQFSPEIGWMIKNGKLDKMIKNPSYTGMSPQFWSSCDGIANKDHWHVWGVPNCGKGQPMQIMRVSHGTSPARFRKVKVGVVQS